MSHLTTQRVVIAAATAFATLNIWTGAPLAAMWVGSLAAGGHALSMLGVCVVVIALAVFDFGLTITLAWLDGRYRELLGLPPTPKRMIGLRAAPPGEAAEGHRRTVALEGIVILNVYVAFGVLVLWYVCFSGQPSSLIL